MQARLSIGARGTGYLALGPLFVVTAGKRSVRYPDVSVFGPNRRGREFNDYRTFDNPVVVAHVMPTADRRWPRLVAEYGAIPSMQTLLLVDWEADQVMVAQRDIGGIWQINDDWRQDVEVPALSLTIPRAEIFASD